MVTRLWVCDLVVILEVVFLFLFLVVGGDEVMGLGL